MAVHDRHDFRIGLVDAGVDVPFQVGLGAAAVGQLTIQTEFVNIFWLHQLRATRSRQQEAVGVIGMTH